MIHLAAAYIAHRLALGEISPGTASSIKYTLAGFHDVVGDVGVNELRVQHIEQWLRAKRMAPATARSRLSQLHVWCTWMIRHGHLETDPTLYVDGPRMPHYLPRGLKEKAVTQALDACPDERALLIICLMVQEGLRCCEVAKLQLADIDDEAGLLLVRGKGRKERVLPLCEETADALRVYLWAYPCANGPLVRSYNHPARGISAAYISTLAARWIRDGGTDATGHALRHTAATTVLRSTKNLRTVQQMLGHASLSSTERYIGWAEVEDLRAAMAGRYYRRRGPRRQEATG